MKSEDRRELTRLARVELADAMDCVAIAARAVQIAAQRGTKVEMLEALETWDKSRAQGEAARVQCLEFLGEEVEDWIKGG